MAKAASPGLRRAAYRVWLSVGLLVLGYALLRVLARPLAIVVPPLLLAALVVYLLNPVVTALERRRVPRRAGTTIAYLGVLLLVAGLGGALLPLLSRQLATFADVVPELGTRLVDGVNDAIAAVGLQMRVAENISPERVAAEIGAFLSDEQNRVAALAVLGGISGLASGFLHVGVVFVLGPVIAFYLLVDLPRLSALAVDAVPAAARGEVVRVGQQLGDVVGGFVRGQLLVALFVGVASTSALAWSACRSGSSSASSRVSRTSCRSSDRSSPAYWA